ncbi:MAG: nickel-binding protein [Salinirussus sp.]
MADNDLIDFGIWREMDADITDEAAKQEALEASLGAIEELEAEGVDVEWVSTDVLEDPESDTECAYCHYRAPSEEAIKEHSERAGLPVTKLTRMDDQLDKETAE